MSKRSKYLHLYQTKQAHDAEYTRSSANYIEPWVGYITATEEVSYNLPHDYSGDYLTFEALENCSFSLTLPTILPTTCVPSVSYSVDDGETWVTTANVDNQEVVISTPSITRGGKVLWKSESAQFYYNRNQYPGSNHAGGKFDSTGDYNVSGNILSLFYGDDFAEETDLPSLVHNGYGEGVLKMLFSNSTNLISAENLILPSTTLTQFCYSGMFYGCTSLTTPPVLPATTLAKECYGVMSGGSYGMFENCTSLTTAPALPATTLADGCYSNMFTNCSLLSATPTLPAETLAQSCYQYMFEGCTSLTALPELPATTLTSSCYGRMFAGCTGLTSIPNNYLPATTLANACYSNMFKDCTSIITVPSDLLHVTTLQKYCYEGMFRNCTSLTTAPILSATTLAPSCYRYMFQDCTALTTAPVLPATSLHEFCYNSMFSGCSSLNYIKAMFTTVPGSSYTDNWVQGVAATGTFVKNSAASWTTTGASGVPSGWTVETAAS